MRSFAREAAKLTAALARADRIAEVLTEDDVIEDARTPTAAAARTGRDRAASTSPSSTPSERAALHDVTSRSPPASASR